MRVLRQLDGRRTDWLTEADFRGSLSWRRRLGELEGDLRIANKPIVCYQRSGESSLVPELAVYRGLVGVL